jgi:hypothetical protein
MGSGVVAVSGLEDPEKMLDQTVNEMQADVIKMRQASAQVLFSSHSWPSPPHMRPVDKGSSPTHVPFP